MYDEFVTAHCFACGKDNNIGFKLKFIDLDGGGSLAYFIPKKEHQGSNDFMHGGLISTLLDEIMAREVWHRYAPAVTARLNVNFLHPVVVGKRIRVIGRVENIKRNKIYEACGEILSEDNIVLANATAILFKMEKN